VRKDVTKLIIKVREYRKEQSKMDIPEKLAT
jgi:hypothetical protein